MGTWGHDTFENDTACDWTYSLEESSDLALIEEALNEVIDSTGEALDSEVACIALAACEVLARLRGNFGQQDSYTETVDKWVVANPRKPTAELILLANQAIDQIIDPECELHALWDEADEVDIWLESVENLRSRLK